MKKIILLFLLSGCVHQSDFDAQKAYQENVNNMIDQRLEQIQEEQTFQYKDIDSTKRALVWVGNLAIKHDRIIAEGKSGLARSQRRGLFWGQLIKTVLSI